MTKEVRRPKREWWIAGVAAGVVILLAVMWLDRGPEEPVYQGCKVGEWLKGHPREYIPAMQAVGTNALPYLLAELEARDGGLSRAAQKALSRLSIAPFWDTARKRRYRARIGLQVLGKDIEAADVLLERVFARPIQIKEDDPGWLAAGSLGWLTSPVAQAHIGERLGPAMESPDPDVRRNACLAIAAGGNLGVDHGKRLVALTADRVVAVRAAAIRALAVCRANEVVIPAMAARLEDEQAGIRWMAAHVLRMRGTNAVAALPALRVAYEAEAKRASNREGAEGLPDEAKNATPQRVRDAIREAVERIEGKVF
ncbi:MAG: hypothetical protein AB1705_28155 [Verrucomicrobiota bacterium]